MILGTSRCVRGEILNVLFALDMHYFCPTPPPKPDGHSLIERSFGRSTAGKGGCGHRKDHGGRGEHHGLVGRKGSTIIVQRHIV